ncbi:MAG TPA: winged helix-turn-helix transcriptional regulator [Solirubrobacterales bacterium]|nr:winged helix-turn-helix transcriptional regulator [Solirubrobacterales bacterium]
MHSALALLATPPVPALLRTLSDGTGTALDLERDTRAARPLQARLKRLRALGVVAVRRRARFPHALEYGLATPGRELLAIAGAVEAWLERTPQAPLRLDEATAGAAITALADCWATTVFHALAAEPLSLAELERAVGSLSYPALQRRLAALRAVGQVRPVEPRGKQRSAFALTRWAREGTGPIVAAARWDRMHRPLR